MGMYICVDRKIGAKLKLLIFLYAFCCTTLCIARSVPLCCVSCPMFICHVHALYRNKCHKHIFIHFSPSGSPDILVFTHQTFWQYSDGDPLTTKKLLYLLYKIELLLQ